jgi:hypothetical protein
MLDCLQCGALLYPQHGVCASCGTDKALVQATHWPPLPGRWVHTFFLLEAAGGIKLPRVGLLDFDERRRVVFNLAAFFLGPFYYLYLGMWRKALTLSLASLTLILIFLLMMGAAGNQQAALYKATLLIGCGIFATRANIDYYKKMVLGDRGWW